MKSPVLLIGFNRPFNMAQVFFKIREYKPDVLYIAIDGPRQGIFGEDKKCLECQDLVKMVDWPCKLHTLFQKENLGCALGVSTAISWAFDNEDRLIILEDDCVPALSFFTFCDEMLEKYKDDTRVWQVCGRSYHPNSHFFNNSDYIFSHYAHIWGWATWKRCWNHYDLKMSDFPEFLSIGGALNVYQSHRLAKNANRSYFKIHKDISNVSSHTWDYQWSYIKLKNGALGIIPCKNLIHNIGSASGAHSSGPYIEDIPSEEMPSVIKHPRFIVASFEHDRYHYWHHIHTSLIKRIFGKICRLLKNTFIRL